MNKSLKLLYKDMKLWTKDTTLSSKYEDGIFVVIVIVIQPYIIKDFNVPVKTIIHYPF